ncbi:MAG: flagellar motor protein MotA [Halobacteriovoraceae bacterium]|nr:flagellar motor protein MotA [Halobacteriovoraceae bacterium]MBC97196.1 flagellar motor protein MotA [Halobacteriovoraceae bacterium]|tara:strand:- start:87346 stop:88686 length:1341 start_codon:yes stop_codon:yes gene_type:complete
MRSLLLTLTLLSSATIFAQGTPKNLDELLMKVKKERIENKKQLSARESKFLKEKKEQASALAAQKRELKRLEAITAQLQKKFESNEKEVGELENSLRIAKGNLGEMFGVVKQIAGDFKGQFQNSNISAQYPGRDQFMANLAERKKLPNAADLEKLFYEIQRELTESGKIVKFKANVVTPDGQKAEKTVTRVGAFNLVADGKYLSYQSETNQILELPRQPQGKYLSMIEDLEDANSGYEAFGLDPSRGAILGMLVQAPSLMERLQQGGVVGYVILCLLALGLVLVAERMVTLNKEGKKIKDQLNNPGSVDESNPVGQLIQAFENNKDKDLETLELKLDETILKTAPRLERGIPTIKILSAVAPLMGLLGTVTGMIGTFQSITLFGTGDPKLMAGGISTALITTVLGLVCAIPLLLLHNVVSSKSKGLLHILEEQAAGLLSKRVEKKA